MSSFPYIFTFYSFKGGVGRTMALLNCAYALASKGRNVLAIDMDLEAPGLSKFLHDQGETEPSGGGDVVELLAWAKGIMGSKPEAQSAKDFLAEQKEALASDPPSLAMYLSPLKEGKLDDLKPRLGEMGRLDFIQARNDERYPKRLEDLNLPALSRKELSLLSNVLRVYFRSCVFDVDVPDYWGPDAPSTSKYDYVLIDSRTGLTEIGGLCVGPLADRLVVFTGLNMQNVQGTADFLKTIGIEPCSADSREPWDEADNLKSPETPKAIGPKPTLIVASPVPAGEIEYKRKRFNAVKEVIGPVTAKLSYHPQLALMESVFVRDYREEYLALEYNVLTDAIFGAVNDHHSQLADLSKGHWLDDKHYAQSIEDVIRLTPQNPGVGEFLLIQCLQLYSAHTKTKPFILDAELFFALDHLCQLLMSSQNARYGALLGRGNLLSDWSQEIDSQQDSVVLLAKASSLLTEVIEYGDPNQKIEARLSRSNTRGLAEDLPGVIRDCTTIIEMSNASAKQKAKALYNRGMYKGEKGDTDGTLADYAAIIDMPDAPAEPKARALRSRGVARGEAGDTEGELADYTAVIDMPDAPAEQKAKALCNRGAARGKAGDTKGEFADYTAVIDMPDAPVELKGKVHSNLSWMRCEAREYDAAVTEARKGVELAPDQHATRANLAIGLLHIGETKEALAEYGRVAAGMDDAAELERIALVDLREAREARPEVAGIDDAIAVIERRLAELRAVGDAGAE